MPPLGVIQVLSRNGVTSVGLVKEWLLTRIKESDAEIKAVSYLKLKLFCTSVLTYLVRTANSSAPTGRKPKRSLSRSKSYQIQTTRGSFTFYDALLAAVSLIFQGYTSCVITVSIKGMSNSSSLLSKCKLLTLSLQVPGGQRGRMSELCADPWCPSGDSPKQRETRRPARSLPI